MEFRYKIKSGDFTSAGHASSEVKKILKKLGLSALIIRRIVVALYEAEVNIVAHSDGGELISNIESDKIISVFTDCGPGIPDIELAMKKGYSTASDKVRQMGFGAGMGLANIKKNSDSLEVKSSVGVGTEVTITNNFF